MILPGAGTLGCLLPRPWILLIYTGTFACFSVSIKSIFARAVIGSPGVVTHSINMTPVCSFGALVDI